MSAATSEAANQGPSTYFEGFSAEEFGALSKRAQDRIRELSARKNELCATVDRYAEKAEAYDRLELGGLTTDEAGNALAITRLIKLGSFHRALELLEPVYLQLQAFVQTSPAPDLAHVLEMARAGDLWARGKAAADPSWSTTEPLVVDRLKQHLLESPFPLSRETLIGKLEEILAELTSIAPSPGWE